MWWILLGIVVIVLCYWVIVHPYRYWVHKGVKQSYPWFPFGDNLGTVLHTQAFGQMVDMVYNMYPKERYSGFYQFLIPTLVLRDPDLIKQITVKDFEHFLDHLQIVPEDSDPLWTKNVFSLKGQKWREMRTTISPTFTSSKMKYMFTLISQSGEQLVNYFLKKNEDLITIEMKDTFTRYANDVIASTAFGVECDSLEDRKNEFYLMGKAATDLTGFWKNIKILGYFFVPQIYKVFKITLFPTEVGHFFRRMVKSNIESREKQGIVRPDIINILLEARKSGLKHDEPQQIQDTGFATVEESDVGKSLKPITRELTDEDITSQALGFFFAGFDSVSSLMSFLSYELAVNTEIQERLIQEVDETRKACNGKITYEALLNMKYLDMVVCESLRKWPNAVAVDRICTKPYTIEPQSPEEKPLHLKENDVVWVPIWGLHRDPQYFPDPERFDPERFNEENKSKIKPYTYLPFGVGPRNCLGSRLALLENKVLFFHLLSHFEIVPVKETQIPLVLNRKSFNMTAEDGFWLGLKRRAK